MRLLIRNIALMLFWLCFTSVSALAQANSTWIKADWRHYGTGGDAYVTWKFENGFNATQFWAHPGESGGFGHPFGFEIQTRRGYDLQWYDALLTLVSTDSNFVWIGFEIEVSFTDLTQPVLTLIKQKTAQAELFGGPYFGWQTPSIEEVAMYDALVCFYNVGRTDRMGEDFNWIVAQQLYVNKPGVLMVQPVDAGLGDPPPMTNQYDYTTGIDIASYALRGMMMWRPEAPFSYPDTPQRRAVVNAWKAAQQKQIPQLTILIPIDVNYRVGRGLGRILWHAGYVARGFHSGSGYPPGDEKKVFDENVLRTIIGTEAFNEWATQRGRFNDSGHPSRQPNQKDIVRDLERQTAVQVRSYFQALGFAPINRPPIPVVGASEYSTEKNSVSLIGEVFDDNLPTDNSNITTQWSQLSGPPSVTFANASALSTAVTFPKKGSYELRLTANDGELSRFADLAVVVTRDITVPRAPANLRKVQN